MLTILVISSIVFCLIDINLVQSLQLRSHGEGEDKVLPSASFDILNKFREFAGAVVGKKVESPGAAMTLTLIAQFHLQGQQASSENVKSVEQVGEVEEQEEPVGATPTGYLKKKLYVARNACTPGSLYTYGESVGLDVCYPMYANLTAYNKFSSNGSVVTVKVFGSGGCSGAPNSTYTETIGCDDNGFYTLAVSSSQGWGSTSGFGVNVYPSTSSCNKNSGAITGSVIIASSPTGCYGSSNGTSDGVSCSAGMLNMLSYANSTNCTGKATTTVVPKNVMCPTAGIYGYAFGYAAYKCFNLN